jgi:hypothetical protein
MFMVRAIFWLTVVALLMPREPDVGLGQPGAGASFAGQSFSGLAPMAATASAMRPAANCKEYQSSCEAGLALVDQLQTAALIGLARVKVEIEHQKRLRGHT